MLSLFGTLSIRLWNLQVAQGMEYQRRLTRQSLRSVRVPGIRGRILDRNGERMADNRPSYCLSLYLEELRRPGTLQRTIDHVMVTLDRLAEVMDRSQPMSPQDVRLHLGRRTPLPMVAWKDLDETAVARFMEHASEFPGVALTVEPVRVYPNGGSSCHLMGYVGRADPLAIPDIVRDGEPEKYHYYLPEVAGKSGVEKRLDGVLRANAGGRLEIQVDVAGFKFDEVSSRAPGKGSDVVLSVDQRIQRAAEAAIESERGAAVVIDPRNGDVLALASSPGYDPNDFVPSIPSSIWNRLLQDSGRPLYNRATGGEYAPGSTFKPITLLAALQSGQVTADTRFTCPGYFDLGSARFRCWQHWGHGSIDLQSAIRYSCNVYLYHSALACGPEAVQEMARSCGFGRKTGISLDFERPGLVPDDAWKQAARRDSWRDGDTCNMAIGQGALLVTPLQLALYASALANGGTLWQPRLVRQIVPSAGAAQDIAPVPAANGPAWAARHIRVVREGMRDAVNQPDGSGKRAKLPNVTVAGKTGTAEYGVKGAGRKMTWMIAFAPFDEPRYAVAVLVEDGVSGGTTVAPRVKQLLAQGVSRGGEPGDAARADAGAGAGTRRPGGRGGGMKRAQSWWQPLPGAGLDGNPAGGGTAGDRADVHLQRVVARRGDGHRRGLVLQADLVGGARRRGGHGAGGGRLPVLDPPRLVALCGVAGAAGAGAGGRQERSMARTGGWMVFGVPVQPSEFAKVAMVLVLARVLGGGAIHPRSFGTVVVALLLMALPFGLILVEPDLGTAMVLVPTAVFMLFAAGAAWRYLLGLGMLGLGGVAFVLSPLARHVLSDYQHERILTFLDPSRDPLGSGWNALQSAIAVGSGGWSGKGFLNGTQSVLGFLPRTVSPTDFIFPVIAEETGFIGASLLLLAFAALLSCYIRTAWTAKDPAGSLLATGIASLLFCHVFVNIGMTIGLLPITGLPLPLVSSGGSFMVSTLAGFGLVQSVHVRRMRREV